MHIQAKPLQKVEPPSTWQKIKEHPKKALGIAIASIAAVGAAFYFSQTGFPSQHPPVTTRTLSNPKSPVYQEFKVAMEAIKAGSFEEFPAFLDQYIDRMTPSVTRRLVSFTAHHGTPQLFNTLIEKREGELSDLDIHRLINRANPSVRYKSLGLQGNLRRHAPLEGPTTTALENYFKAISELEPSQPVSPNSKKIRRLHLIREMKAKNYAPLRAFLEQCLQSNCDLDAQIDHPSELLQHIRHSLDPELMAKVIELYPSMSAFDVGSFIEVLIHMDPFSPLIPRLTLLPNYNQIPTSYRTKLSKLLEKKMNQPTAVQTLISTLIAAPILSGLGLAYQFIMDRLVTSHTTGSSVSIPHAPHTPFVKTASKEKSRSETLLFVKAGVRYIVNPFNWPTLAKSALATLNPLNWINIDVIPRNIEF